jgi:hypothetical protein
VSSQPFMFNRSRLDRTMSIRTLLNPHRMVRAVAFALLLSLLFASAFLAYGQTSPPFTLTIPAGLNRPAVDPGGSAIATIDVTGSPGFSSAVLLSCAVSSGPATTSPPNCTVSPSSVTPPASASLTITTTDTTAVGLYDFTVTGTSGSTTETVPLSLTVQPLSEDYTLAVSPTTAVPNPVAAGSAATATVTVSPIGSYSGHNVTLSCLTISPVVTLAPVCSFNPATVAVTGGQPPTSVLTINTTGPAPVTRLGSRRIFYAFWLSIPGLGLMALSTTGARRKAVIGTLLLTLLAGGVLLMPACGSSSKTVGNVTPNNTYVFTLTGADENGAAPSNNTTNQATVSITVN